MSFTTCWFLKSAFWFLKSAFWFLKSAPLVFKVRIENDLPTDEIERFLFLSLDLFSKSAIIVFKVRLFRFFVGF
ncbi:hypothetical protein CBG25_10075 [Arsenophonus sp. ENCA]|nr:hypothetical protein CBG25_10075 [Arsenophonus sp. ENCA]